VYEVNVWLFLYVSLQYIIFQVTLMLQQIEQMKLQYNVWILLTPVRMNQMLTKDAKNM
jgi:hypothetical protein